MRRILSSIFRIGIMKRLSRGIRVSIIPSYACNYDCSYCGRRVGGVMPSAPQKTLEEWKGFLSDLDETLRIDGTKIKEIVFTGGEPTLLPYFVELSNWILEKGWFMTIYTNLWGGFALGQSSVAKLAMVKQSTRLRVFASYHPEQANDNEFLSAWKEIDKIHRTDAKEIGKRVLKGHKKTKLYPLVELDADILKNRLANLRVDPKQRIFITCRAESEANVKEMR